MWRPALAHIDLFEERYGITDRSRILRTRAYITGREFAEAERCLDQISQHDPSWRQLKAAILEAKGLAITHNYH